MFNTIKPIQHYFPNIATALHNIEQGKKEYKDSTKYTLIDGTPVPITILGKVIKVPVSRGELAGTFYVDAALCAIMYATGKEPKLHDLNTPGCYGWTFEETRDLLNALDALSKGDPYYWNLYYGTEGQSKIISPVKIAI